MKIVNYETFLQLPKGTIFCYVDYPAQTVGTLFRKGENTEDSYTEKSLLPLYNYNLKKRYILDTDGWEACIKDKRQKYLVYEENDLDYLKESLEE